MGEHEMKFCKFIHFVKSFFVDANVLGNLGTFFLRDYFEIRDLQMPILKILTSKKVNVSRTCPVESRTWLVKLSISSEIFIFLFYDQIVFNISRFSDWDVNLPSGLRLEVFSLSYRPLAYPGFFELLTNYYCINSCNFWILMKLNLCHQVSTTKAINTCTQTFILGVDITCNYPVTQINRF